MANGLSNQPSGAEPGGEQPEQTRKETGDRGAGSVEAQQVTEVREPAFFPLPHTMMEHAEFRKLPAFQRVVLVDIIYQLVNHAYEVEQGRRKGPYYRTDETWGHRLRMSGMTFRKARRKLGALGWVLFIPGFRAKKGALATRFVGSIFANTTTGPYASPWRRTWTSLILLLQQKQLDHLDLAVFASLAYLWRTRGGRQDGVATIRKASIRRTVGLPVARFKAALGNLERAMPELFTVEMRCRTFELSAWTGSKDAYREVTE